MNSLNEFYKFAKEKKSPSITGPLAGSIVGSNLGIGARVMIEKKPWAKGWKGVLATAAPGMIGALGGLYAGERLSKKSCIKKGAMITEQWVEKIAADAFDDELQKISAKLPKAGVKKALRKATRGKKPK